MKLGTWQQLSKQHILSFESINPRIINRYKNITDETNRICQYKEVFEEEKDGLIQ